MKINYPRLVIALSLGLYSAIGIVTFGTSVPIRALGQPWQGLVAWFTLIHWVLLNVFLLKPMFEVENK